MEKTARSTPRLVLWQRDNRSARSQAGVLFGEAATREGNGRASSAVNERVCIVMEWTPGRVELPANGLGEKQALRRRVLNRLARCNQWERWGKWGIFCMLRRVQADVQF